MRSNHLLAMAVVFSGFAFTANAQQAPRPSFEPVTVPDQSAPSQPSRQTPNGTQQQTPQQQGTQTQTNTPTGPQYTPSRRLADPEQSMPEGTLERAERQNQGNYKPMDRSAVTGPGVPLGTTQDAWSNPREKMSDGQVSPGVIRFRWRPELVMPIRVREYMLTMITLPEWEKASEVLIGENLYFQSKIVRDNTIAIKATASGIDTSVNIIGSSGNNYTFYVRSESYNTEKLTELSVFVDAAPAKQSKDWFRGQGGLNNAYPEHDSPQTPGRDSESEGDDMIDMNDYGRTPESSQGASGGSSGQSGRRGTSSGGTASDVSSVVAGAQWYIPKEDMNFAHKMYEVNDGDRVIAPNTVYTNGIWTFFHYGKRAASVDHPVVYRVVDGVETLVNTRWIGKNNEVLVAEATGDFVLRNGAKTVCIMRDVERDTSRQHSNAVNDTPDGK